MSFGVGTLYDLSQTRRTNVRAHQETRAIARPRGSRCLRRDQRPMSTGARHGVAPARVAALSEFSSPMAPHHLFSFEIQTKKLFSCEGPSRGEENQTRPPSEFSLLSAPRVQLACSLPLECAPGIWQAAQTGSASRAESASVGMARSRSGSPSASSSDGDRRRKPSKRRESPAGSDGEEGRASGAKTTRKRRITSSKIFESRREARARRERSHAGSPRTLMSDSC